MELNSNHLYWKSIPVEVTAISHSSRRSGSVVRKWTNITVYSKEYVSNNERRTERIMI